MPSQVPKSQGSQYLLSSSSQWTDKTTCLVYGKIAGEIAKRDCQMCISIDDVINIREEILKRFS